MVQCSPPLMKSSEMSKLVSSKQGHTWYGLLSCLRTPHVDPSTLSSSSSSSSKNAKAALDTESKVPHPPPPRPPRPKTSLPNLRPTVILSPITVPPTVYIPPSVCSTKTPKVVSFSEDVFAALPVRLRPHNDDVGTDHHDILTKDIWREFTNDLQYVSKSPTWSQPTQTENGYMQRENERNDSSEVYCSPYASSSCLGTSFASHCREQKHLEFSSSTFNLGSRSEAEQNDRGSEPDQESYRLTPLQAWIASNRRLLWMIGVVAFVLVASSAVTGAIIWRLTTFD